MLARLLTLGRSRRLIVLAASTALVAALLPLGGVALAATPTQLVITSPTPLPTTANSGVALSFTVTAEDGSGNVATGFTGTVTVTSSDPLATLTPSSYTYTTGDNGSHTFSVTFATAGSQSVTFSSPGLNSASATLTVSQSKLAITSTYPSSTSAGTVLSFTVQAQDYTGAPLSGFTGTVSVTSTDPHALLPGPVTYSSASSTFNVTLTTVGTWAVSFASPGLTSATSSAITVTPGTATRLVFVQEPAASTPTLLSPQPTVGIADTYGNVVSSAPVTAVTLSLNPNPTGATLSCTNSGNLTVSTSSGLASYSGCSVSLTGSGYRLSASAAGYTSAQSDPFSVTSGPASRLAFCWGSVASGCSTTAPTGSTGGTAFPAQPTVLVQDAGGNTVTSDSSTVVTLSIATAGTGATLSCTGSTSLRVTSGVASFSGCAIDKVGTYQLTATSVPYDTPATSNAFTVSAGPPVKLTFTAQPTSGAAGQPFAIQPAVAITDAGGNVAATSSATISLALSGGTSGAALSCTGGLSRATVSGVATFTGCSINTAGTGFVITAVATNVTNSIALASASTGAFNVSAPAAQITVTPSSSVIIWARPVVLTTQFGVNGANKPFALQASMDRLHWYTIASLTTNASGSASFSYTPATNLWYQAVFAGTPDLTAGTSAPVRVVVRQIALLRPTNEGRVVTVAAGATLTWNVTVRPNRPELPRSKVGWVFYYYRGGHWEYLTTRYAYTNSDGIATYSFRFDAAGAWYVRAQAFPTPYNANSGWSPVNRYNLR